MIGPQAGWPGSPAFKLAIKATHYIGKGFMFRQIGGMKPSAAVRAERR